MPYSPGFALLLLVVLFSCAPAPETSEEEGLPPGRVYALTEVRPMEYLNEGGRYGMLRMELTGDSARIFNPFTEYSETIVAMRADGAQETSDSVYLSYTTEADTALRATLYTPAQTYTQRYRAVDALPRGGWPVEWVGQTFRVVRDTGNWVVHLAEMGRTSEATSVRVLQAQLLRIDESDGRRVTDRTSGYGFVDGERVFTSFRYPGGRDKGLMRPALVAAGQLADDSPALYVLGRDTINPEPEAVLSLEPYPSLLPEDMDETALLALLNRSRMEIGELPAEPDSVGIDYQVDVREHDPVLKRAEVPQVDVAFTSDGKYTLFAEDRIVREGSWSLSKDRNFIFFLPAGIQGNGLSLIAAYNEAYLSVPLSLEVETKEARGVRLRSYYHPLVDVRFYHEPGAGPTK